MSLSVSTNVAISAVCIAFIALVIGSVALGITSVNGQAKQGKEGPAGVEGATGPSGASGFAGVTGVTGLTGVTGATGVIGATGAVGAVGATGANGLIGVFSRTLGAGSVAGTTEVTMLDAGFGVGSLVYPPNTITLGMTLCFVIGGFISTASVNNDITFRVLAGDGTILAGAVLLTASCTPDISMLNVPWNIRITIVNTLSAILVTNFMFCYSPTNSVQMRGITRQNSAAFTGSINNTFNVTAKWAAAGSTLLYSYATLTRLF